MSTYVFVDEWFMLFHYVFYSFFIFSFVELHILIFILLCTQQLCTKSDIWYK